MIETKQESIIPPKWSLPPKHPTEEEKRLYQKEALRPLSLGKQQMFPYMTLPLSKSAAIVMTAGQKIFLLGVGIYLAIALLVFHLFMVTFLLGVITVFYLVGLTMSALLSYCVYKRGTGVTIEQQTIDRLDAQGYTWPAYTILCPLYHEVPAIPGLVKAIQALSYPTDKLQVFFITQEDDIETITALSHVDLPTYSQMIVLPKALPQTKARACNYGLIQATGEYITIFDAEDRPDPYQLKKVALTFAQSVETVACVQAKLDIYNTGRNTITHWFTSEYNTWWNIVAPGFLHLGLALPLGGSSNHLRTNILRALGGWDAFNVTEDCDLGLRLSAYGFTSKIVNSVTYEEAPSSVSVWIKQRSRWIKGYMQTYLVHTRQPFQSIRKYGLHTSLSLHLIVGCLTALLFLNPIMWTLTIIYIVFQPVDLYHRLFPPPLLYAGSLCFIFGNFFFIYQHMMGCLSRGREAVMKYALVLPFYWFLMPIPAYMALFQLLFHPFYWAKTPHTGDDQGMHFQVASQQAIEYAKISSAPTQQVAAISLLHKSLLIFATTTSEKVKAIKATSKDQGRQVFPQNRQRQIDWWCIGILLVALVASIFATVHSFVNHDIILYYDAHEHLRFARMVFDSLTPGVSQMGVTWLPLPHLIMLPFIWNDYLWRTGLAGSLSSMCCYLIATLFIYRFAKRLSQNQIASAIATLVFVLNPNILYLQTTPLSELISIATMVAALYYFFAWVQNGKTAQLFFTAICVFLATLARYDGWAIFCILLCAIPLVGILKRYRLRKIESMLLVYTPIAALGIVLWMIWNWLLEGNPFYFKNSPTSSEAQTVGSSRLTSLPITYHNLGESIRAYALVSIQNIGWLIILSAIVGLLYILIKKRVSAESIGVLVLLTPFLFYIVSFYTGNVTAYVPGVVPANTPLWFQFFNARFGAEMVASAAIVLAPLIADAHFPLQKYKELFHSSVVVSVLLWTCLIGMQTYMILADGIVTLQDGQYGTSCRQASTLDTFLAEHYDGGVILATLTKPLLELGISNLDGKDIIWSGSNQLWKQALAHPTYTIDWVVVNPDDPLDDVAKNIQVHGRTFLNHFTFLIRDSSGIEIFRKKGLPPLPTHSIPSYITTELAEDSRYCRTGTYPPKGGW